MKGSIPIAFHEGKDPFFIAVTKAPEEKEVFAAFKREPGPGLAFGIPAVDVPSSKLVKGERDLGMNSRQSPC